jgi:predicted TIM-barrel fold metal-dependent hydrolase
VLQDNEIPVHVHGGTGGPDYGAYPVAPVLYIAEAGFYSQRPLVHLILSGVFERFPRLRFVLTELGCSWVPDLLAQLDSTMAMLTSGRTGELRFGDDVLLPRSPSEYFRQNVWLGVSQPRLMDASILPFIGPDRYMWGNDYPHEEGTYPFTREHLRQVFHGTSESDMRKILGGTAADLYGFDLEALVPYATKYGPTVSELDQPLTELPAEPNQALLLAGSKGIPE